MKKIKEKIGEKYNKMSPGQRAKFLGIKFHAKDRRFDSVPGEVTFDDNDRQ